MIKGRFGALSLWRQNDSTENHDSAQHRTRDPQMDHTRNGIHFRDPTEAELAEATSSTDPRCLIAVFESDEIGVLSPEERAQQLNSVVERMKWNLAVFGETYIIVDRRDPTKTVFYDITYLPKPVQPKETDMEKNGNTFAPGDTVVAEINNNGKTASARRSGTIQEACNDDQVKVAWSDGTTSLERPEHLQRG